MIWYISAMNEAIRKIKANPRKLRAASKPKRTYSEADSGSMAGYDPDLGLGKAGYAAATRPKPSNVTGKVKSNFA